MIFLINASNLYAGGGVQVALSFLDELKSFNAPYCFHVLLSPVIHHQLDLSSFGPRFSFYLIEESPASLFSRRRISKTLSKIEAEIAPDVVFSIFGPTYWRPKSKHLMGFADGWVFNKSSVAFDQLSPLKRAKMRLHVLYKIFYLKTGADRFVVETTDAKYKLANTLQISPDRIFVVGNAYSSVFNQDVFSESNEYYIKLPQRDTDEFRLIYIAHNHPSKNLSVINQVLPFLSKYNVKFVLTVDTASYNSIFADKSKDKIINLGSIPLSSCPSVYRQCDALFAPSLLETFSAAYPEAMRMELPVITSEYSFATDVCSDAALYFNPLDPRDIADKIIALIEDSSLRKGLIKKGSERLQIFETAYSRACKYINICETLAAEGCNSQI